MAGELTNWKAFDDHALVPGPEFFGFKAGVGDVNRFAARYRAARCFRGIEIDGYSDGVRAGYAALCRVLFVYSALEAYIKIMGIEQRDLAGPFQQYGAADVLTKLRAADPDDRFYKFIYERVNEPHKKELDRYFNDDPFNIAYLASAIRHIFAHGWLTPSAGGGEATQAVQVCDLLSEFILGFLDSSFSQIVDAGLKAMYEP